MIQLDTLHRQKAFSEQDLDLLTNVAIQSGMAIENSRLVEELLKSEKMRDELEMARGVQESLLPKDPPDVPGYIFHHFYRPMSQIGGDYFDYLDLDDGRLAIIVGDVVGHGPPAALLMAKLSSECRMGLQSHDSLPTLAELVNESFARLPPDQYATLMLTILNPRTHQLEVMNAGHLPPLVRRSDGQVEEISPTRNFAIGLFSDAERGIEFTPYQIQLDAGDSVLLHTDGLNEAMNENDEEYTRNRICQQMASEGFSQPDQLVDHLITDVGTHFGNTSQKDDICLVCFRRSE